MMLTLLYLICCTATASTVQWLLDDLWNSIQIVDISAQLDHRDDRYAKFSKNSPQIKCIFHIPVWIVWVNKYIFILFYSLYLRSWKTRNLQLIFGSNYSPQETQTILELVSSDLAIISGTKLLENVFRR